MATLESEQLDVNTWITDKILGDDPHVATPYLEDYFFRIFTDLTAINAEVAAITVATDEYTVTATAVEDRTLLASADATTINNNNVLAALIADLQSKSLIS